MRTNQSVVSLALTVALLIYGGACTKTETVEVEKIVEKPAVEAPGNNSTVSEQPTSTPIVIATGSDMEVDTTTGTSTTNTPAIPEPAPLRPLPVADHIEPVVKAVSPAKDSQGASLSTEISAKLSEAVKAESITTDSFTLQTSGGSQVSGKVRYDTGSLTAIFTPNAPLLDGETYTATLTQGVEDLAGNKMLEAYSWPFKVRHEKTVAISTGQGFTFAVKENGSLWAWGRNKFGQLGDGTQMDRKQPVRVRGLSDVDFAGGGYEGFAAALKKDGTVWTWGRNNYGQLGDGTTTDRLTPAQVPNFSDGVQMVVLLRSVIVLKKDGTVWGWGNNTQGQLGNAVPIDFKGTIIKQPTPVQVVVEDESVPKTTPATTKPLQNIIAIAGGSNHILALQEVDPNDPSKRVAWAWGYNFFGQLGVGYKSGSLGGLSLPVRVLASAGTPLSNVKQVFAFASLGGALTQDGKLYFWGYNGRGQIGDGTTTDRYFPVEQKAPFGGVATVGSGLFSQSTYVVGTDGSLWGWGDNGYLKLMEYTASGTVPTSRRIGTVGNIAAVSAGMDHVVLLKKDGSVMSVGLNIHGELGTGTASFYNYHPNLMSTVPAAQQLSRKSIVDQNGKVWLWDRNLSCEMTLPDHGAEIMVPLGIDIPDKITQVARSGTHVLALSEAGEVWAWGDNKGGQLGNGGGGEGQKSCTPAKVKSPDGFSTLSNIVAISAGSFGTGLTATENRSMSLALQKNPDGSTVVWAWGDNWYGQLGLGTGPSNVNAYPQKVVGIPTDKVITAISAGTANGMALTSDGMVYGWGMGIPSNRSAADMGVTNAIKIAGGNSGAFILTSDGVVHALGNNIFGALGINKERLFAEPNYTTLQTVADLTNVVDIAAGGYSAAAITADGQLWTWGNNMWGQLGTGDSTDQLRPVKVTLPDGSDFNQVKAVSVAYGSIFADYTGGFTAVRNDGTVWDWGYLNIAPTYMVREGEASFSGTPLTVNWP